MVNNKKSFGEIWSELTEEQSVYLKGYIDRQRKDAVKHHLNGTDNNLMVLESFILHLTHCSKGDWEANKTVIVTPNELYTRAKEYVENDHVDGANYNNLNNFRLRRDLEFHPIQETEKLVPRGYVGKNESANPTWCIELVNSDLEVFYEYFYTSKAEYKQDLKTLGI